MTRQPPKTPAGVEPRWYVGKGWQFGVRWTDPITQRRLREELDSVEEALDFKAHLRLLKRRGQLHDLDRGRVLLVDFAQRWFVEWAKVNYPPRTLRAYAGIGDRHLLPRVGGLQLRQVTPAVVDQLKTDLATAGVGAPTIRKALAVLSAMLRQAVVWGELEYNPVREIKKPSGKRSKVITPLSVEQVEAMIAYLEGEGLHRDRMLVELLAYAAGRPQDVLALSWEMVGQQRLVYAWKNVNGKVVPGAKTGEDKARSVALLPVVRRDLLAYRMQLGNPAAGALVVPRADGKAWLESDYRNWSRRTPRGKPRKDGTRTGLPGPFARAAAAAGVPAITPYYLRHTYASLRLAEQRLSLQEIADELGHDVDVLAKIYAHVISEYRGEGAIDPDALIAEARAKIRSGETTIGREAM
jgi:integrase